MEGKNVKRSQINSAIQKAIKLLDENNVALPMFGHWTKNVWEKNTLDTTVICETMLGWDVTDFGSGDFEKVGAVLFTARNGDAHNNTIGTPYAEKYIILNDLKEQEIPFHFHKNKIEDIINRGGGLLMIELYNSFSDGSIDTESNILVNLDGVKKIFKAGSIIEITRGNSITLTPGLYHKFYAKKGFGALILPNFSN